MSTSRIVSELKNDEKEDSCKGVIFDGKYLMPARDLCSRLGNNTGSPTVDVAIFNKTTHHIAVSEEHLPEMLEKYNQKEFVSMETCRIPKDVLVKCRGK